MTCPRCDRALEPDYGLPDSLNRVRAWMWRQAHRLNCRLQNTTEGIQS